MQWLNSFPNISVHNDVDLVPIIKPVWIQAVEVKPVYLKDKISPISVGFRTINNNTIELTGTGNNKVEGAQWSRGFTSGKHIIEFIFPIHLRTTHSRVGIAPEGTSLGGNDIKRVVGGRGSWAVDVKSRTLLQNGRNIGSFPPWQVKIISNVSGRNVLIATSHLQPYKNEYYTTETLLKITTCKFNIEFYFSKMPFHTLDMTYSFSGQSFWC